MGKPKRTITAEGDLDAIIKSISEDIHDFIERLKEAEHPSDLHQAVAENIALMVAHAGMDISVQLGILRHAEMFLIDCYLHPCEDNDEDDPQNSAYRRMVQ